jgi:hypothetical protein
MNLKLILYSFFWILFWIPFASSQQIVEAEYFIDNDPGVGKATKLSIPNKANAIETSFDVNFTNLTEGNHFLVIRVKDEQNRWSLSNARMFVVVKKQTPITVTGSEIVAYEIIFPDDKGVGSSERINVNSSNKIETNAQIQLNSFPKEGTVAFGVRVLNKKGEWSLTNGEKFFVTKKFTPKPNEFFNYTQLEYFIDNPDPGLSKATPLTFTKTSKGIEATLQLDKEFTDLLTFGRHFAHFRVKTDNNVWSLINSQPFDKCPNGGVIGGFDIVQEGRKITITDKSQYAESYSYDIGTTSNTLNKQIIENDASFEFSYILGGTYKICQTVSNFCKTETICKEIVINAPRLKAGKTFPSFSFKEDDPLKLVVNDLNEYFEDPNNKPITYSFIVSKNTDAIGQISNNKSLSLAPKPDVSGNQTGILTMKGGGLETDFQFRINITPSNDAPKAKTTPTIADVVIKEDSPTLLVTNNLLSFYFDPDGDAFSIRRVFSDVPDLTPSLTTNSTNGRISLNLKLAPNYFGEGKIFVELTDSLEYPTNFLTGYDTINVEVQSLLDAPVAIKAIPNVTLNQGFGQKTLLENLDNYFTDVDGDNLTYSSSTNNSSVQLKVEGKKLIITANSSYQGTATGKVTASDGFVAVSSSFEIKIIEGDGSPINNLQNFSFCASTPQTINLKQNIIDNVTPFEQLQITTNILSVIPNTVQKNTLLISIQNGNATFTSTSKDNAKYSVEFSAKDADNKIGKSIIEVDVRGATITQLNNTTLQANQGERYQWYNANGQVISGATQQSYQVTGSLTGISVEVTQGTCKVRSSPFGLSVGLEDLLSEESTSVYPNPTSGAFELVIGGTLKGKISAQLYDLTGRLVLERFIEKSDYQEITSFDIQHLSNGIYSLRLFSEKASLTKKIVKR